CWLARLLGQDELAGPRDAEPILLLAVDDQNLTRLPKEVLAPHDRAGRCRPRGGRAEGVAPGHAHATRRSTDAASGARRTRRKTSATPAATVLQPAAEVAWARSPQRKSTVSAPSRKTPAKAMVPSAHRRPALCASSTRCWSSPLSARACCRIHQPCHVRRATAAKITTAATRSGPRSRRGPDRKLTPTPAPMLARRPRAPPSVT